MMSRWKILLLVIGLALGLSALWVGQSLHEPRHEGKPVAYWLNLLYRGKTGEKAAAKAALRTLGSEIVPDLVGQLGREDNVVRKAYGRLRRSIPRIARILPPTYDTLQMRGYIFRFLNSLSTEQLQPALPEMIRLLRHSNPNIRSQSVGLIGRTGDQATNAVEAMAAALREDASYAVIAHALGRLGRQARAALPVLEPGLTHSNIYFQMPALRAVARIHPEHPRLPELLLELARSPSRKISRDAVMELRELGWRAEPVLDPLRAMMLTETNQAPRRDLEAAVTRIEFSAEAKRRFEKANPQPD